MVTAVSYSTFRNNLKSYLRKVNEDADTLLVTNTDPADDVVVMGKDDYESLMETMRVYGNPYLRDKITRGLQQVRASKVIQTDPTETITPTETINPATPANQTETAETGR